MAQRPIVRAVAIAAAAACVACHDPLRPDDPGNLVPRTVTEDPSLPAVSMNGARFHLQTLGSPANPAIVFLHAGPGGDYRSMLRLADRVDGHSLADDYFLIFWDQRGAGLSQRVGRETLTETQYLADLDTLVGRYSPGRPVYLLGVSWGGMLATHYIDTHPDRVAGAVLVEPGPLDGTTMERVKNEMYDFRPTATWLNDYAWSSQFLSPDAHARMDYERMLGERDAQPRFHKSSTDPEPGWRQGAAANHYLMADAQDGSGRFTYDFAAHLAAYRTPVLFVAGALSEVLGPSLQREQMRRYPAASLTVVDGAGHDVAWVRTADVLTAIRPYLAARRGGAP